MGAVYLAKDQRLADRQCAVKVHTPIPGLTEPEQQPLRQQFAREAEVLAHLEHPNLARVTDYFSEDGYDFLVMDYVAGQNLLAVAQARQGNISPMEILGWMDQVLKALDYMHRQEPPILHRDIKPANIILTPVGLVKLVDFGLVKQLQEHTPHTVTGMRGAHTPGFAPPEQFIKNLGHTDARSDLYAVGATLYNLLTGSAPAAATERLAEPAALIRPQKLNPAIPLRVEQAVIWSLSLRPDQRPQNVNEMRAALGLIPGVTAVPLQPGQADPSSNFPQPSPDLATMVDTEVLPQLKRVQAPLGVKRIKFPIWLMGIIALLLLIGGAALWQQVIPESDLPTEETPTVAELLEPTTTSATLSGGPPAVTEESVSVDTLSVGPPETPFPTLPPRPTPTGPSYWPDLQPITLDNITNLTEVGNLQVPALADVAFSPDGSMISISYTDGARIIEVHSMEEIQNLEIQFSNTLTFSPNGGLMAIKTYGRTVPLWQTDEWQLLPPLKDLAGSVGVVVFSPDSLLLAVGMSNGEITLWRLGDGQLLNTLSGHTDNVTSLAFTHDGQYLISGSEDRRVRVWQLEDGRPQLILTGHADGINSVAVSNDGQYIASGSDDTTVRVWRFSDGELLHTLNHHIKKVDTVSFAPNSTVLATVGFQDVIYLWQVDDGSLLSSLDGGSAGYLDTFFFPNGELLAARAVVGGIRFWGILSE